MKKLLLAIGIGFSALAANANHDNSQLNLSMSEYGPFNITLDNQSYYVPGNSITFGNLVPGSHMLLVTKPGPHGHYGH